MTWSPSSSSSSSSSQLPNRSKILLKCWVLRNDSQHVLNFLLYRFGPFTLVTFYGRSLSKIQFLTTKSCSTISTSAFPHVSRTFPSVPASTHREPNPTYEDWSESIVFLIYHIKLSKYIPWLMTSSNHNASINHVCIYIYMYVYMYIYICIYII